MDERGPGFVGGRCGLAINVLHHRNLRRAEIERRQILGQRVLRWLHQRTMEWSAHLQHDGTLGPAFLGEISGTLNGSGVPRDDDLIWRINVRGRDYFALGSVVADVLK